MPGVNSQATPTATTLLRLSVPAILIGVVSALGLFLVEGTAHLLEHVLWVDLPGLFNLDPDSGWWIFAVLSGVGLAVGVVCTFAPGRGGRDSATVELLAPPLPLAAVPGLILVSLLVLAGGVSLGPESPIIAINTAILVALIVRFWPRIDVKLVMLMTAAGTIGALFGTPVAAALVLTGVVAAANTGGALWDRLFLPLLAAATGSLTVRMLDGPQFGATDMPPLGAPHPSDLLTGALVACAAALVILAGASVFRALHESFRRLRSPLLYTTLGGVILGGLGALGGPVTLFKGGQQMADLIRGAEDLTTAELLLIVAVKLTALLVAATAGFRGGRIFPAVFIGAAVGLVAQSLMPEVPLGLALACGILGAVLAESRDGWIALFIAVVVVGDISVLAVLCVVVLPVWLLVMGAPKMLVPTADHQVSE
ncbi:MULTISPECIES: ion channel protein [unclassified Nesterenkonia]|uniref:ion channel protein n=1 Tax=unclassified Nesterenkonia TaxID=2629769 RepID=UPI001F4C53D3|nr:MULTISPECIES: ion channel protein [unclassified Nesterenkonia]MCH8559212.1 ion channel protein [Nesterenkonia sp. DZ6]MCH8563123.1 ion channel protein [Nesterenkonia sp. YGD6]